MKYLKYWLLGLLVWEVAVLLTKDEKLRKKLSSADKSQKLQFIVEELVDFNKEILTVIKTSNFQKVIQNIKNNFDVREQEISQKIESIKSDDNNKKAQQILQKISSILSS